VASLLAELVDDHGYAEVVFVPGDQTEVLRKSIRSAVRQRLGCKCETFVHQETLHVHSSDRVRAARG